MPKVIRIASAGVGSEYGVELHGETETFVVAAGCSTINGRWACATHRAAFGSPFEKDAHLRGGSMDVTLSETADPAAADHVLVWVCFQHGPESP